MLKFLRDNRTGIFGFVILGFVSITMVGFGINFFAPQGPNQAVIKVDSQEISYREYYDRLSRNRAMLQRQLGDSYEQFASMINLEQQTVDQIIDTTLLEEYVNNLEITPSTARVFQRIQAIGQFDGVLTASKYEAFLRSTGMSGPQMEAATRQELALNTLRNSFADVSVPTEKELKAVFLQAKKEMSFHLATFSPSTFEKDVSTPSDDELKEYFSENEERYRTPDRVQYQAASFRAQDHMRDVDITDEDLQEAYEQDQDTYTVAPKVSFRRIVLKKEAQPSDTNPIADIVGAESESSTTMSEVTHNQRQKAIADAALKRIEEGEAFQEVAKELSEDEVTKANGGLVEETEYSLLPATVRTPLYDLEVDEVSSILEDSDAYYIVVPVSKTDRYVRPIEEVSEQVKNRIRSEYAPEYARIAAEEFTSQLDGNTSTERFSSLASEKSVPVSATAQPLQEGQSSGAIPPEVTNAALGLDEGEVEIVEARSDSYVILVTKLLPSSIPPFEEVKANVLSDYRSERAEELAKQAAETLIETLTKSDANSELQGLLSASGASVKTTPLFQSSNPSEPLFRQPELLQEAFSLRKDEPVLSEVQQLGSDYVVITFADEKLPEESDFESEKPALIEQEQRARSNRIFATLQKLLREKADVWVEPTLLESGEV